MSEAAEEDIKKVEEATTIPEDKEYQPKDATVDTTTAEPSVASASRPPTTYGDDETLHKASFESTGAAMADAEKDLLRELERGITHTSIEDHPKPESSTHAPAISEEPAVTEAAEEEPEKGKQKAADNSAQDGESEA